MQIITKEPTGFSDYFRTVGYEIEQILNSLSIDAQVYYVGSDYSNLHNLDIKEISTLIVIVGNDTFVEDAVTGKFTGNFLELQSFSAKYADKKIISVHTGINYEKHFVIDNLIPVSSGTDMMMYYEQIKDVSVVNNKQFTEPYHWISCSMNPRSHRMLSALALSGLELDNYGLLKISPYPLDGYSSWQDWCIVKDANISIDRNNTLSNGFYRLKNFLSGGHDYNSYRDIPLSSRFSENFNQHGLKEMYENAVVELVNECWFYNEGFNLTEKTVQAFLGYTFPILLAPPGSVKYLRSLGFDMFDDIIDHSYDNISNPMDRIFIQIENNKKILTDREYAIDCWYACCRRMDNNVNLIKHHMHDIVLTRFRTEFNQLISKLGKGL